MTGGKYGKLGDSRYRTDKTIYPPSKKLTGPSWLILIREDKPEEFMELRRSYEEAVELAKRPDEDAESADEDGQKEEYFQTLLPPEHPRSARL